MQVLKTVAGVRSLKAITATASSARVLDLHTLAHDCAEDPEHQAKPLFIHPVLNRAIIVKHNCRPGAEDRAAPRQFNATKLIFPFDPVDLNLGGQSIFVDQHEFLTTLTRHLDYKDLPLDRDVEVLRTLDKLPTLDPFLVREVLAKRHLDVAPCYYRLTETDKAEMMGFVSSQIETLIAMCFGEMEDQNRRAKRLSKLLLADQDSPELEPLRLTLRMDADAFSEAIFAWKAFLYYHWRSRALMPMLKGTLLSITRLNPRQYDAHSIEFVRKAKKALKVTVTAAWNSVLWNLRRYDEAFEELTERQNPEKFRDFLENGSRLFVELGERIGRMEQVVSFWTFRFDGQQSAGMSPEDVLDAVRELLQGLSLLGVDQPDTALVA